jgi:hypothetical protein
MNAAHFLRLSTTVCDDLRSWIEEARRQALLSEGQLLTLSDAAAVIDQATRTMAVHTASAQDASTRAGENQSRTLDQRAADAADEAGSALLPRDKVLSDSESS